MMGNAAFTRDPCPRCGSQWITQAGWGCGACRAADAERVRTMEALLHRWRRRLDPGLTANGALLNELDAVLGTAWGEETPGEGTG